MGRKGWDVGGGGWLLNFFRGICRPHQFQRVIVCSDLEGKCFPAVWAVRIAAAGKGMGERFQSVSTDRVTHMMRNEAMAVRGNGSCVVYYCTGPCSVAGRLARRLLGF